MRERIARVHGFPDPEALFGDLDAQLRRLVEQLPAALRPRLHGIGVAAPLSLEGWHAVLGIAPREAARWAGVDIRARIAALTSLPVEFVKDTAAACVAELVAGRGRQLGSFLYLYVDAFIGGGLVIDSQLRAGRHGNAGAVASMPVPRPDPAAPVQLVERASLVTLDARYAAAGLEAGAALDTRALQRPWWPHTEAWLAEAAPAIALAVGQAACLLDLDGVIVDGVFSRELLATDAHCRQPRPRPLRLAGRGPPRVARRHDRPDDAIALGGALLPLHANFAPDHTLFLKLGA